MNAVRVVKSGGTSEEGIAAAGRIVKAGECADKSVFTARNVAKTRAVADKRVAVAGCVKDSRARSEKRVAAAGRDRTRADPDEQILTRIAQNAARADVELRGGRNQISRQCSADRAVSRNVEIRRNLRRDGILNVIRTVRQWISRVAHPRVVRQNILIRRNAAEPVGICR
ncbi:MAG: hypothetical protein JSS81_28660 [Acidobacteria bacterium]|nr:hypothetical protein [Acidobacteriota bacterium]